MESRGMDVGMELLCRFTVVNRQGGVFQNFSRGSIAVASTSTISTSPEEPFIAVCASSEVTGTKYNLVGNIVDLCTEFLNEGQAEVSLKEPNCNIFIANDNPYELTEFITYLKAFLPKDSPMHVSSESPNPQKNLYLYDQEQYKQRMENVIGTNTNLDQFTDLNISDCILKLVGYQVPIAGAIRKMKNLTTLQLKRIDLRSSTFLEIESKELKQLHFCGSKTQLQVSLLFKNDLCYKDSLVELHLDGNRWTEIPNAIFEFRNLLKLSLGGNCITQLPDKFMNLPKLQELDLSSNRLTHVPPSIFALQNLTHLSLIYNLITELPNTSTNSSKLQVLSLSNNQLRTLPTSIFECQNLSELSLDKNRINELPDMFAKLSKLRILDLSRNRLRSVPSSIFALQNLPKLLLIANLITELPKIINLPKLEYLSLSHNQLRSVPPSIFQLQNLSILYLDHNLITELPDMFTNLPKLKVLSLRRNQLQYLPSSILSHDLFYLDIAPNPFNLEIPPSVGTEMVLHSLKELTYRTILNHMLKIKEGILKMESLKGLDNYRQCICGRKFVGEGQDLLFFCNLNDVLNVTYYNRDPRIRVPVRGKMCTSFKSCFLDRFPKCR